MKYPLFITGRDQSPLLLSPAFSDGGRAAQPSSPPSSVTHIAPAVHVLRHTDPFVESQLRAACASAHAAGKRIDEICAAIYQMGIAHGYQVTLAVQEVYSNSMPSYPGKTVMTALIMVDFESPLHA